MNPSPASPSAGTTIFEAMSRLCGELGAINLGQGFPDLPEPPELIEAARTALAQRSNQYPPMRGLPELRAAIAGYYAMSQRVALADEQIIVTSGATEALASSILALVQPGDEVILVQPLYDAYLPLVERAGGVPRFISLVPPDWAFPLEALVRAITPRTRLLVLNTPNNPTGTLLPRATLEAIGALCAQHDLTVICDEVWEAMVMDGTPHASPFGIASLRERTVKIGSAGKIFSLTGWKVGWAVAAPALAERIARQHQFLTFTTATPLQWAVAAGLALPASWHTAHRDRYVVAKQQFTAGLESVGYRVVPANGTWFSLIDLAASGLPADDAALAQRLVREAGVGTIPVSAFYAERPERGYLRLCFAKRPETLGEAIGRLAHFRSQFGGG